MERISTNRDTRRQQFRAIARGILDAARGPIGRPDRIGDLARAMERAYAAGTEQAGSVEEPPGIAGWVAWESMPRRSQEVLQEIAGEVRLHIEELRAGQLVAIVEGAGPTSPRGARARFSICRLDGDLLRRLDGLRGRDWAASSVSALVRLGVFQPLNMQDAADRAVVLTDLGMATIEAALASGRIYTY